MVRISYSPTEELVVHEILHVQMDDLLRERVTPAAVMPLYWCQGILFSFNSLPLSDEVTKDYLKGKIHWLEVHYTSLPEYTPILPLHDDEYKSTLNVRVIDTSFSALHQDFIKWLKVNTKK
ncbi:MAG: hypothetical protein KGH72_00960 [Candidatus Micrarchaeota archaeon]|nr:hypothetical protein [Candidatus Micrarchaeota archaeon]